MCPTLYEECVGSFMSHRFITCARACETGHMVYRPYPRRLESLTFADIITKTALSPQLVKDPERWSSQGLNLRPPDQQTRTYPVELTSYQFTDVSIRPNFAVVVAIVRSC